MTILFILTNESGLRHPVAVERRAHRCGSAAVGGAMVSTSDTELVDFRQKSEKALAAWSSALSSAGSWDSTGKHSWLFFGCTMRDGIFWRTASHWERVLPYILRK